MKKVSIQEHAFVELIEMCCKILSNKLNYCKSGKKKNAFDV